MPPLALAQGVRPEAIFPAILPALIALLVLIIAGTIVLTVLRRSLKPRESDSVDGFTLHGLRELHARGDLTDDEFERAKAAVIERARGGGSGNAAASAGGAHDRSDTKPPDSAVDGDGSNGGGESPESSGKL